MASLILRDSTFYIQFMVSGKAKRLSTGTDSLQIAKAKLKQFEDAKDNSDDNPLPTRTRIGVVVTAYVSHIKTVKTRKSAQTDTRRAFQQASNPTGLAVGVGRASIGDVSEKAQNTFAR